MHSTPIFSLRARSTSASAETFSITPFTTTPAGRSSRPNARTSFPLFPLRRTIHLSDASERSSPAAGGNRISGRGKAREKVCATVRAPREKSASGAGIPIRTHYNAITRSVERCASRNLPLRTKEHDALLIRCGKKHALTLYPSQNSTSKVHDVWKLLPHELFRCLPKRDTGNNRARTKLSKIDGALDELVCFWNQFSRNDSADADIELRKIAERYFGHTSRVPCALSYPN